MQGQATLVDRFNSWLRRNRFTLPSCPISHRENWSVAEHVVEFRQYQGGFSSAGVGSVYPAVMIICDDCGYTMFINAAIAGLV